jgi:hypothetical protein
MCRSKKDGRKQGGHSRGKSLPKWQQAKAVRRARIERRNGLSYAVWEHEQEMAALEQEIMRDFTDQWEDDWSWTDNLIEPDYGYEWQDNYDYTDKEQHFWDDPIPEPDSSADVHLAVGRAVRRHGVQYVYDNIPLLAAALDVAAWQIEAAIRHTPSFIGRYA